MAKAGRNEPCPCGSGRKFKRCCASKGPSQTQSRLLMIAVGAAVLAAVAAGVASFTTDESRSSARVWDAAHGHYHDANGVHVP